MASRPGSDFWRSKACGVVAAAIACCLEVKGQTPRTPDEIARQPIVQPMVQPLLNSGPGSTSPDSDSRFRLFRMAPGFLSDPVGLRANAEILAQAVDSVGATSWSEDWPGDGRLKIAAGPDNPYFDFRASGEPGGLGYYKVHTQYQLFDGQGASWCFGLQAVTPAGVQWDGVSDGPTVLSPAFGWFYDLGDGTAVQGFVSQSVRADSRWQERLDQNYQYGLALQRPVVGDGSGGSLHLFIEALGRYQPESPLGRRVPANWELLPGLHWRLADRCWLSGGVIVPVGSPQGDNGLWQITGSWRF